MIEVSRTADLDRGIVIFTNDLFLEKQVQTFESKTGLKITKYYKQQGKHGIVIASYVPKKDDDVKPTEN